MKSRLPSLSTLISLAVAFLPALAAAAPPNPVIVGPARFTVVTPLCIRLEYDPACRFVDQPSLFAADRSARFNTFTLERIGNTTVIDTGTIRLTYLPDGRPFSPDNLQAVVSRDGVTAHWVPGAPNPGNLGGTIRTLDGVTGPVDLGQGLISRDGWYMIDDSRTPLLTSDWVESRPADAGTDWYLFGYGDDYKGALKSLAAVSGPVPLPRKYALGAWYSRYWPYSSAEYRQIVAEYSQHDFPLDNIVLDMDWHKDGWTGWSWNRVLLPDAEDLLAWFHSQSLHVTLNLHPADGVGPQEDHYAAFMRDMGTDPATKQTLPFDAADPKYMGALFQDIFTPLERDSVDFWWLDWQQDEKTRSIPELTNLLWLNTLLYQRTAVNGQRGLSFSRWAGWGDQRHPIHFSGDADTGFPMLAFEVPFTATAGNVGCFFWSHDIGGHEGGRNEESYARWVQFGAVSPALRSHSTRDPLTDRRPWNYPAWAEDSMRASFHLRSELFPYLYGSAAQASHETVPMVRPLYLDYPKIENAYHNGQEYLLGDGLLAAPIVSVGAGPGRIAAQTVWFPPGTWFDFFTGERFAGMSDALAACDIKEFPLYVRGGVPIPMQPYQARMATAPLTVLRVRCWPGDEARLGTATLYEDDGQTTDYQQGQCARTQLSYLRHGSKTTITVGPAVGRFAGQPMQRRLVIELPDSARAQSALLNGKPVPAYYNAATGTNTILVPLRSIANCATVVVQAMPFGWNARHAEAVARRIAAVTGTSGESVEAALEDTSLTSDQREALLAVLGVGLVRHNDNAYLYGDNVHDYFYAPAGMIDSGAITSESTGERITVRPGMAQLLATPVKRWRGKYLPLATKVAFLMNGQTFHLPTDAKASSAIATDDNIAQSAKVTVNGSQPGYSGEGAVDGQLGGYPSDQSQEWSAGMAVGASITLTWGTPQTIDHIALYDRPNLTDQVTGGRLTFSDGSTLDVGALPNDGMTPLDVRFAPKTITSVTFNVTAVKPGTQNAGLEEIAVFKTHPGQ